MYVSYTWINFETYPSLGWSLLSSGLLWKSQASSRTSERWQSIRCFCWVCTCSPWKEKDHKCWWFTSSLCYPLLLHFSLVIITFRLDSRWPSQTNLEICLKGAVNISAETQLKWKILNSVQSKVYFFVRVIFFWRQKVTTVGKWHLHVLLKQLFKVTASQILFESLHVLYTNHF